MAPEDDKPNGHGKPADPPGHQQAEVTVEDGDNPPIHRTIAAEPISIPDLLAELGLTGDLVLWLRRKGQRILVNIHELLTPQSGDRFIAVRGGGVS